MKQVLDEYQTKSENTPGFKFGYRQGENSVRNTTKNNRVQYNETETNGDITNYSQQC